jgi:hypothetical protein
MTRVQHLPAIHSTPGTMDRTICRSNK